MRKSRSGYSLIELIVVLGITAAVVVILGAVISTVLLNYDEPVSQQVLLQQVQNAGYLLPRDIQMSNNVTLSGPTGFPATIQIPVDQSPLNDYEVDYVIEEGNLKRMEYDAGGGLVYDTLIAQYVVADNTTLETTSLGRYRLTISVTKDDEYMSAFHDIVRRLTLQ